MKLITRRIVTLQQLNVYFRPSAWSCDAPPIILGGTMDPASMDLDTWPRGTIITYDCGLAVIDTDSTKSEFTIECNYNPTSELYEWNSNEWNSTHGYSKIPKCLQSEYWNEQTSLN